LEGYPPDDRDPAVDDPDGWPAEITDREGNGRSEGRTPRL